MLAIAIISLIGTILSFFKYLSEDKFDANIYLATISIISWWHIALPISIILIAFMIVVILWELVNS